MKNPIKPNLKTEIIPIIFVAISIIASFFFYQKLPEQVVTHWNFEGVADGYSNRAFVSFFFPATILVMYLVLLLFPVMDPKKDRYDEFKKVYHIFKNSLVLFYTIIFFVVSFKNLGYNVNIGLTVSLLVGSLFIMIGNYMGKIKRNWFLGIRTPWTLSSDEVWNKTHRFGGKIFMIAGFLMILIGLVPDKYKLILFIFDIALIVVGTIVYSYVVYLKEQKKKK